MMDAIGLNEYARSQAGRVGVKIQFDLQWAKTNVRNLICQRRYLTIANSEPLAKSPRRGTAIRVLAIKVLVITTGTVSSSIF